jgi:signal transduction histidine kinase
MTPFALASPRRTLFGNGVRADDNPTEPGSHSRRPRKGGAAAIRQRSVALAVGVAVRRALRRERHRIAADLHDEIGQAMAAAHYNLSLLEAWARGGPRDVRRILREVTRIVSRTLAETRRIAADLQPRALEGKGFEPALRGLLKTFTRRSGAQTRLLIEEGALPLCQDAQALLFRILQESLNNVAAHARAKSVKVHIVCSDAGVVLSVADDGVGLAMAGRTRRAPGMGVAGMRRRVRDVGGSLRFHSVPGRGTRLVVTLRRREPLPGPGETAGQ